MMKLTNRVLKSGIREFFLYVIFGVLITIVSLITYWLFTRCVRFDYYWANALSWIFAVSFAFVTNKKIVFRDTGKNFKKGVLFLVSRILTLLMKTVLLFVGIELLDINDIVVKLIVLGIVIVVNYLLGKIFVFCKKRTQ